MSLTIFQSINHPDRSRPSLIISYCPNPLDCCQLSSAGLGRVHRCSLEVLKGLRGVYVGPQLSLSIAHRSQNIVMFEVGNFWPHGRLSSS